MKTWAILLGGFTVWTVHFFGLYAVAEIAPPSVGLVAALTGACLIADLWLLLHSRALQARDHFDTWRKSVAIGGAALSLLAVVWQALPALAA